MHYRSFAPLTLILAVLLAGPTAALDLGAAIPEAGVKMHNVDGRDLSIADVKGAKGTLVVFTSNHCPWAKAWEERIVSLGNTFQKRDIGVIAINANDPSEHKEDGFDEMVTRAKARDFEFPYVVDRGSKVARAFGAERTPEAYLFDADGKLVYRGTIDDNAEDPGGVQQHFLGDALDAVATGKAVQTKETKALGCSIKFYES